MTRPDVGDTLYIGRRNGDVTEAFRRTPDGALSDIEVGGVESSAESFHVTGKPALPGVEPWTASCDRDTEATDTMLRGRVRAVTFGGWHGQGRAHVVANMERYGLSPRQREVAWLLFAGWTNLEMAEEIGCSASTMKNYVGAIIDRIGLNPDGCAHKAQRTPVILRLLDLEGLTDSG